MRHSFERLPSEVTRLDAIWCALVDLFQNYHIWT